MHMLLLPQAIEYLGIAVPRDTLSSLFIALV